MQISIKEAFFQTKFSWAWLLTFSCNNSIWFLDLVTYFLQDPVQSVEVHVMWKTRNRLQTQFLFGRSKKLKMWEVLCVKIKSIPTFLLVLFWLEKENFSQYLVHNIIRLIMIRFKIRFGILGNWRKLPHFSVLLMYYPSFAFHYVHSVAGVNFEQKPLSHKWRYIHNNEQG